MLQYIPFSFRFKPISEQHKDYSYCYIKKILDPRKKIWWKIFVEKHFRLKNFWLTKLLVGKSFWQFFLEQNFWQKIFRTKISFKREKKCWTEKCLGQRLFGERFWVERKFWKKIEINFGPKIFLKIWVQKFRLKNVESEQILFPKKCCFKKNVGEKKLLSRKILLWINVDPKNVGNFEIGFWFPPPWGVWLCVLLS